MTMKSTIYIEKTDIGATLTTWIYCAMWQKWAAEQQGLQGYVNWPDGHTPGRCLRDLIDKDMFAREPNMYNWYFKQPAPQYWDGKVWTWENWSDHCGIPFMAQPLHIIKDYYKRNLIFSDEANKRGQLLVDKYNIDFTNTTGITWRGTDNVTDGRMRMPIEKYYKWIDQILSDNPTARIMCTAEEEGILDPLLARYPQAFRIEEFVSAPLGGKHNPERSSPVSGFERGLQPALMVWLFSKCAWYIKNRSSTGAVASWLSNGYIVNLGHAETLSYEKMDNEVEINGKRYEL